MSKFTRSLLAAILVLAAVSLSACGGALAAQAAGDNSPDASKTEFLSTDDGQSTDAPKVETETPGVESTEAPEVQSTETPEAKSTESPDANEVSGVVTAIDATSITVDGVVYSLADFTEIKGTIQVGDNVTLELTTGLDGTLIVREVKTGDFLSGDHSGPGGQDGSGHDTGDSSGDGGDDHGGGSKP